MNTKLTIQRQPPKKHWLAGLKSLLCFSTIDVTKKDIVQKLAKAKTHEWVSFEDPDEERTWVFDLTFFLSSWECIYKAGCAGIEEQRAPAKEFGCCVHGAHMSDEEDFTKVLKRTAQLTSKHWQFMDRASRDGGPFTKDPDSGADITKVVDGACIFLNRPDFEAGAGCAFHLAALESKERPLDWKPEVCWQVPIRREDQDSPDGHITTTISQWDRKHWGDGGHEFAWWCTDSPEAFSAANPLYRRIKDEIVEMSSPKAYKMLCDYIEAKFVSTDTVINSESKSITFLPHPQVRKGKAIKSK